MKFTPLLFAASLATGISAHAIPRVKRDANIDTTILNFALLLEHLEANFYDSALKNFTQSDFASAGYPPWVFNRLTMVRDHEASHVEVLTSTLKAAGAATMEACQYKFPYTDVTSFIATARVLETVGSSAYTGAAAGITGKDYLTAAASILGTETRHSGWVGSAVLKEAPWGTAYETPLGFRQVFTLAAPFVVPNSCPSSNPPVGFDVLPSLTVSPSTVSPGDQISLQYDTTNGTASHVAFISGLTPMFVELQDGKATIPQGLMGPVYVIATNSNMTAGDNDTVAGPVIMMFDFNSNGEAPKMM